MEPLFVLLLVLMLALNLAASKGLARQVGGIILLGVAIFELGVQACFWVLAFQTPLTPIQVLEHVERWHFLSFSVRPALLGLLLGWIGLQAFRRKT